MKTKASRIIFIPSFGTNSTLYDNIKLADENHSKVIKSEWLGIQERESFETYALKFINHYDISHHDILVGTSLGGIIAQEINKQIPVKQVIIISSLKSEKEMPRLFTMIRQLRLYYFFSPVLLKLGLDLVVPLYGRQVKRYLWFRRVFKQSDNDFLRWSFKNIVHWKNESIVENLIHKSFSHVDREICHLCQNSVIDFARYGESKFFANMKPINRPRPMAISVYALKSKYI